MVWNEITPVSFGSGHANKLPRFKAPCLMMSSLSHVFPNPSKDCGGASISSGISAMTGEWKGPVKAKETTRKSNPV